MEDTTQIDLLKYPIGRFLKQDQYSKEELNTLISTIEAAPDRYRKIVESLSSEDFTRSYRPGSWNVLQLIHHVADIQLLHFLRMKKALTEHDYRDVTLIDMDSWVNTPDGISAPPEYSLIMMEGITKRYVFLLRSLTDNDLRIEYFHPVRKYMINQAQAIAMSAWHVRHHMEHIKIAVGAPVMS
jgi:hypothetical protein